MTSKAFVLHVAENPNPRFPSLQAALEASIPLLAQLIVAGEAAGSRAHSQPTPAEAETIAEAS